MIRSRRNLLTRRKLNSSSHFKRFYQEETNEEDHETHNKGKLKREFILSVLEAQPTPRDSRLYLKSFGLNNNKELNDANKNITNFNSGFPTNESMPTTATLAATSLSNETIKKINSKEKLKSKKNNGNLILSIPKQHIGLVKIQGPFTDRQLKSIVDGVIYLKTLGLMSIIIVDDEAWHHHPSRINLNTILTHPFNKPHGILNIINPSETRREAISRETARLSNLLELRGSPTRPIYDGILKLTDYSNKIEKSQDLIINNLNGLKSAIQNQEIPIIPPIAINSSCATICIQADLVVKSLALALSKFKNKKSEDEIDLTPLRLMIINREGGIPSPARNGYPHLSINLASEFEFINETFRWSDSHPTSLANLSLAKSCLKYLPNESSAIIVSHRSPKSLIANLITNKPAHSPSLKHSILQNYHQQDIKLATPTLIRKGLPIKVIREIKNINLIKLKDLLEKSFKKKLDQVNYFNRLKNNLKFMIIAGDYQGAAIVTNERLKEEEEDIIYLDKFVVLPSLQGEGIVDFLWGALRDETFGLGNLDALNNNGGLSGIGQPVDLIWRSRIDNPVNRWYFERSNGFYKLNKINFSLFWCFAENFHLDNLSLNNLNQNFNHFNLNHLKIKNWCNVINLIPSSWLS